MDLANGLVEEYGCEGKGGTLVAEENGTPG